MTLPVTVELTEVGMRDGFQMELRILPTEAKVAVGNALLRAGVKRLEATSFVSSRAVPQLADAEELVARLRGRGASIAALAPNRRGAIRAADAQVDEIVVFVSASESHNQANVNRTIENSLEGVTEIADVAAERSVALSGSVATAFGCPFEGDVPPAAILRVLERYAEVGIRDVVLGDTTGMATPPLIERVLEAVRRELPQLEVSLHFHNTRGLGLVNVMTGLQLGVTRYESSLGGLGGCPFAPGATGNVCSEDLVYMLDEMGISSGIDIEILCDTARMVEALFGRQLPGQVMKAGRRVSRQCQRTGGHGPGVTSLPARGIE
jgi:hydroxymethylglutaryl-CoA lyase